MLHVTDWVSFPLTRHSLIRWYIQMGCSPNSLKMKKQPTVSQSSTNAEYRSMVMTTCELKRLQALLLDQNVPHSEPVRLHYNS